MIESSRSQNRGFPRLPSRADSSVDAIRHMNPVFHMSSALVVDRPTGSLSTHMKCLDQHSYVDAMAHRVIVTKNREMVAQFHLRCGDHVDEGTSSSSASSASQRHSKRKNLDVLEHGHSARNSAWRCGPYKKLRRVRR
jgi:hypothetical protein